ncbi:MAG: TonB-dependent receptor [Bacteroidales bacterium]|nr:TonB-dependent receptor [Bacteroidales bacterium]
MRFLVNALITFLITSLNCYSQVITIIDNEDLKPIPDVVVLNESKTKFTYSNRSGKADISDFANEKIVCFQHTSYERVCLTPDEIDYAGFTVRLVRKIFAIEEFVISANRWEQNRNEVPNRISTILKPAVELQGPQTAADLIGISDEVFIQKSQLGGGSPMIRGFATNRILIVVDGVRMNNAIYREGNIQNVISLDPSALESTEIIFGPGASVYGSDAIGGVMDFHTKKALLSTGGKPYIKADAFARRSSANREGSFHLDFNAGTGKMAFLTSITRSVYDNLKMGSHRNPGYLRPEYVITTRGKDTVIANPDPRVQVWSGYKQLNTMNKVRFKISEGIDLVLANHYSRVSDVPRYDRLIQYRAGKLRYAEWYYGPQVWMMNNLQLTLHRENKLFDEMRLIAARQDYKESRHDRSFNSTSINGQTEKVKIFSVNLDFDKAFDNKEDLVFYGLEFVNNDIRSDARTINILNGQATPSGSRYPNGKNRYSSFSVYAGYKNNISGIVSLNTGLRYNYVDLHSTITDNSFYNFPFTAISISNGAFTGAFGAVIKPGKKMHVSLNGSTGFRAPNLDDAGKVFDSAPGIVVVPNPDLKPEYAFNIDAGLVKDFGKIIHAEVYAYHTWLNNAMTRHDFTFDGKDSITYQGELSKVEAITNTGSARVYGFHFSLQMNLSDHLLLKSALNITEGHEQDGVPLRHSAPLFGSTHLILEFPRMQADLYSLYNGSKKFEKMPPSEIEKPYLYAEDENGNPWSPGWFTLNFKLSYGILKWISVNAGVENILDIRYRPYSSGIVSPGRNFITSLRLVY